MTCTGRKIAEILDFKDLQDVLLSIFKQRHISDKMPKRLTKDFYQREDVVQISKELLGKVLVTTFDGQRAAGRIVETEAYRGPDDKACHAHNNRYTNRSKIMFRPGGRAYIYLCYGIHHLFNVVTAFEGMPHAVLVRAVEPLENIDLMLARRNFTAVKPQLTAGPGVMSKALGITREWTGLDMTTSDSPIWLEDHGEQISDQEIIASPRVGVDYAEDHALWPWRFRIKNNRWTSPAK